MKKLAIFLIALLSPMALASDETGVQSGPVGLTFEEAGPEAEPAEEEGLAESDEAEVMPGTGALGFPEDADLDDAVPEEEYLDGVR